MMMNKRKVRVKIVNEGTGNYWPGYSDDGTADSLSDIRKKTSKIQNDELRKKEKKVLSYNSSIDSEEKSLFFQKWMYANMIMTSLQDGFYIDYDLLDKAFELYQEIIDDPNLDVYLADSKHPQYFPDSIELILTKLGEKITHEEKDEDQTVYAPGFLDKDDEERIAIDKKYVVQS